MIKPLTDAGVSDQKLKDNISYKDRLFSQKRNDYESNNFTNEVFKVALVEKPSPYQAYLELKLSPPLD